MTKTNRTGPTWRTLALLLTFLHPPLTQAGDNFGNAYSGLNHFIPISARVPLYKLKAQQNQLREKIDYLKGLTPTNDNSNLSNAYYAGGAPGAVLSSCSVNIGNITPGSGANGFGSKETIVLIEGDIINVADCSK